MSLKAPLWTRDLVINVVQGEGFGPDWQAFGVSLDTREVMRGDLFIAIGGETTDGHDHLHEALRRGAAAVILDHWPENLDLCEENSFILVKNTFEALWDLARFARARFCKDIKIAALTGSVGKTTTKAALAHILGAQALTAASAKSLNTKLGVPLSLARSSPQARYGVFEVGMSEKGEIAPLSKLLEPHVAVITMLAPAHLKSLKTLEDIAQEKLQIATGLSSKGVIVLNQDMPLFEYVLERVFHGYVTFGNGEKADLRLLSAKPSEFGCFEVTAQFKGDLAPFSYTLQAIGTHFAYNSLAALLSARQMGANMEDAVRALETFKPEVRRGQYEHIKVEDLHMVLLDESYNANPTSMRAALEALAVLPKWKGGRTVAVLGDMRELGEGSRDFHRSLAKDIESLGIDAVYTCGEEMEALYKVLGDQVQKKHVSTSQDLFETVRKELQDKDNIMVKGSLSMKMDAFIKALKGE